MLDRYRYDMIQMKNEKRNLSGGWRRLVFGKIKDNPLVILYRYLLDAFSLVREQKTRRLNSTSISVLVG